MARKFAVLVSGLWVASAHMAIAQTTAVPAAAAEDASVQGIEDIVVTAQRREQRLQDIPLTVNAISAQGLERQGVTNTADLNAVVPGLNIAKSSTVVQPFLRGVGTASLVPGNDPSVPLYIDGVYHSAPAGLFFSFNNIERVEVLKGPQGTLFGRNATGGLIQIVTKDPTEELKGKFSLSYGNYRAVNATGYISGGTDTIAANLSVVYNKQSKGWGRNLFQAGEGGPIVVGTQTFADRPVKRAAGYTDEFGIHSKIVMTPDDRTTVKLSGMYVDVDTNQNHYRHPLPGRLLPGPPGNNPYQYTGGFYDYNSDVEWYNRNHQYMFSAEAAHEADFATLKSISSFLKAKAEISVPSDASPLISRATSFAHLVWKTYTQELQLLSNGQSGPDWLEWIGGLYYLHGRAGYDPQEVTLGYRHDGTFSRYSFQTSDSLAAYGQATFDVTDSTRLTLGARYSKDRLSATQYQVGTSSVLTGANANGQVTILVPKERVSFEKVTWRIALDQRVTPDVLLYASASRGYKTGALNHGALCATTPPIGVACSNIVAPTRPEVLDAYEVGFKSDLFDRRLRFNVSAYYYDYADLQVQAVVGVPPVSVLNNAAQARIYGVDLESALQVTPNLRISANASFLNSKYKDYPAAVGFVPLTVAPYANRQIFFDASGNTLPRAPKFSSTVAVDWTIPTSAGDFTLTGSWYHNDGFYWDPQQRLRESAYDIVNGQLAYQATDRLKLRVWGRNLLDKKYYSYQTATSAGDQGAPAAPRTYGIAVDFEF
ncbi:TonB-dependent receptor [Rhizorhabdus dicambivorans]|uniref:TonB-dependent receptor n=1 Tax=Rhizorhabdus dicambivorans TaxID=1850238 RepID=A0A2A4FZ63_9SPHN|nr:TonB-dependent receptor [Rhizorhabdus dicambivorans]ATE63661.1 TonB-dependent receptor [Rhizorhabdus dicambivorans]PCE42789.1 TonB-dependent receptor [Rhizorhabdus dicambivorans]